MSEVYDHMAMQRKSVFMLYYAGKQASDIAASLGGDRTMKNSNTMLKKVRDNRNLKFKLLHV